MNERIVESKVRAAFAKEYPNNIVEEQQSSNTLITKLLKTCSKKGTGKTGYPDFIMTGRNSDTVVVVECKADINKHEQAQQEVLHYARCLRSHFTVIAVAVSGEKDTKLSRAILHKDGHIKSFRDEFIPDGDDLVLFEDIRRTTTPTKESREQLVKFANNIHEEIRDKLNLAETEKPLLISGILVALSNSTFRDSYYQYKFRELPEKLLDTLKTTLRYDKYVDLNKVEGLMTPFKGVFENNPTLHNQGLRDLITRVKNEALPFLNNANDLDAIGHFYSEFLRYGGSDKKALGIVLTPKHITEVMVKLLNLREDSIIIDNCCGTGGFLIAALQDMLTKSKSNARNNHIRTHQLVGIEHQPNMYAMAAANLFLRSVSIDNLYRENCFEKTYRCSDGIVKTLAQLIREKHKPTAGLLNPPYSQKESGLKELDFIYNALEMITEPGGRCAALVPLKCAIALDKSTKQLKKRILVKHTLEAVMNMPKELFKGTAGVDTCIMVFRAGIPHNSKIESWFADWSDDDHSWSRYKGRVPGKRWEKIKEEWTNNFFNKKIELGKSVKQAVDGDVEWAVNAYIETNYQQQVHKEKFQNKITDYITHVESRGRKKESVETTVDGIENWKSFKLGNLFKIERGCSNISIKDLELNQGSTPVVSSSALNNGITCYTDKTPTHSENKITVANRGSVGSTFYQDRPFYAYQSVMVLTPKFELDKYIGLFLSTLINTEEYRFSFGREWNLTRMQDDVIKLPVDENGNPNWKYMRDFIKELYATG